jgi:hypothetical protein
LLPGNWAEPIRCEVFTVEHDIAHYQALSYVWGSARITRSILFNGKCFPVTVNLESSLRHLREQYENGLVLWIDALCIDQENVSERTQQVQLMGKIYEKAVQVIVYLGDQLDGNARRDKPPPISRFEHGILPFANEKDLDKGNGNRRCDVFDVFLFVWELSQLDVVEEGSTTKHLHNMSIFQNEGKDEEHWFTENMGQRISKETSEKIYPSQQDLFEALRMLMHPPFTPWWTRIWVIQEVTVAKDVRLVYGTVSAPWTIFGSAATNFAKHSTGCCSRFAARIPRDYSKVLVDFRNRVDDVNGLRNLESRMANHEEAELHAENQYQKRSILNLLRRFRDRRASDPRDKVRLQTKLSLFW